MMKLKKPKFWDYQKPNLTSNILLPISKIVYFISKLNKKKKTFPDIKSICVGNIYIGGTGKTSLSIELKKIFDKKNIKCCFIKKKYSNQLDEQTLLKKYGKTFIEKSRIKALEKAIAEKYQVAIFDDGLQDKNISYDLTFVCFNQKNMIGNGRLIPSGPLREELDSLKKNKNVFLIGNDKNNSKLKELLLKENPSLNFYDALYKPSNLENIDKHKDYIVFSGIGNHVTFVDMLNKNKIKILKDFEFPDHYNYSENDIREIQTKAMKHNAKILTTKKDYLRIDTKYQKEILFIDVCLEIHQIDHLKKKLNFLNESN